MIGLLKGIDKQNLSSLFFEQLKSLNNVVDNLYSKEIEFHQEIDQF